MRVTISNGSSIIGTGVLEYLDPPMGVAFGQFSPTSEYHRDRHANTIEGVYIGDVAQSFSVRSDKSEAIRCTVAIEYWSESLGEQQLTVWFQDSTDFKNLFSAHNDFNAYYGHST